MRIRYTASYKIASSLGHVAGQTYDFDAKLSSLTELPSTNKKTGTSLGGNVQSLVFNFHDEWRLSTIFLSGDDLLLADECFASILDGQQFIFDAYGDSITVDNPVYAVTTDKRMNKRRLSVTEQFAYSALVIEQDVGTVPVL